ncbi:hypothetical protein CMV_005758 [Castanea mollissima]|uniref:Uncharacterized protein n=1 Tax=Castanea mollissima TaxID=60419 RepID=A0A8J4VRY8_9ROSI|nr:hypothetical protein CMV_005758 [Castanea mollissima]
MQLEDLRIVKCGLEEVVALEDSAEAAARLPLLKVSELIKCDQIEIFVSKYLKVEGTVKQSQLETSIQQPLFLVEEGPFPNLEDLRLGGNFNLKEI